MGVKSYQSHKVQKYMGSEYSLAEEGVIGEVPVTLMVNGEAWLDFMCTPHDLESLATGFLYNEGIINLASEILMVEVCPKKQCVDVWLNKEVSPPEDWRLTSGCAGGITSVKDPGTIITKLNSAVVSPEQIIALSKEFFEKQVLYQKVRGVHGSALSDGQQILAVCEDIGRHNSVDKIAGKYLLGKFEVEGKILLTSGRISSEMAQKAHRLGVSILISRTSPTVMSIEFAEAAGITLVGYARGRQFAVYTHPHRIMELSRP
ncbi:MAG: formate dehydrogenase accessory sulfurtransferase FdhD [Anaerolineae bacterium]|nr:formate dehydrogenase accessory sulfurtransferase FdhD [Anaerolineae bacterium]